MILSLVLKFNLPGPVLISLKAEIEGIKSESWALYYCSVMSETLMEIFLVDGRLYESAKQGDQEMVLVLRILSSYRPAVATES